MEKDGQETLASARAKYKICFKTIKHAFSIWTEALNVIRTSNDGFDVSELDSIKAVPRGYINTEHLQEKHILVAEECLDLMNGQIAEAYRVLDEMRNLCQSCSVIDEDVNQVANISDAYMNEINDLSKELRAIGLIMESLNYDIAHDTVTCFSIFFDLRPYIADVELHSDDEST